jgi:hypothetical protein
MSSLLTKDVKSLYLAQQFGIMLNVYQLNALFNSEGGWAQNPPKWNSVLGKVLYLLDEISSNVTARTVQGNVVDVREKGCPDLIHFEPNTFK